MGDPGIIPLADFRTACGDKWPKLAAKIGRLGGNVLGRHVGRDGMFCQADEQTFVVTLPRESREKARVRVVKIAQDLSTYLLGDMCIKGERPLILAANIPFEKAISSSGGFELNALAQAVADSRSMAAVSGIAAEAEATSLSNLEVFRVGEAYGGSDTAAPEAEEAGAAGENGWQDLNGGQAAADPEWRKMTKRQAQSGLGFSWEDPGPLTPDSRLSMVWRPIWLAGPQAIGAYSARVLRFEQGQPDRLTDIRDRIPIC